MAQKGNRDTVDTPSLGWGLGLLYNHLFGLHLLQKGAPQAWGDVFDVVLTWPFYCVWWSMDGRYTIFSHSVGVLCDKHIPALCWCVVSKQQALHLRSPAKPNIRPAFLSGCILDGGTFNGICGEFLGHIAVLVVSMLMNNWSIHWFTAVFFFIFCWLVECRFFRCHSWTLVIMS